VLVDLLAGPLPGRMRKGASVGRGSGHGRRAIVNADDLGFSRAVTEGILRCHGEGIVTSATLAANMPGASWALARLRDAPGLGVGVHLNVSQGPPLSEAGRRLAGSDGLMGSSATRVVVQAVTSPWTVAWMAEEFDAQVRFMLDHGVRPTHVDTHRHAHGWPGIFVCIDRLAERYDIPFIRRHHEVLPCGFAPAPGRQRRLSAALTLLGAANACLSRRVRGTRGTWGVAHTGRIDESWLVRVARSLPAGVTEIMTHPGLAPEGAEPAGRLGASRPGELKALCSQAVRVEFERQGIERIHYGQLSRR
jgi:predicted glycoside hydrolase/deacetylase ChbG (UPF0249 family)